MPDGSKWAEHVDYFDLDDLQQHGKKLGRRRGESIQQGKSNSALHSSVHFSSLLHD